MFSHIGWRAYSQERGESVTRGDRRQRELGVREFVAAARPLLRIRRRGLVLDGMEASQLQAKKKS
jgi:hypothetical protein